MQPGAPAYRPRAPSQGTAETLILVAFILQLIFSLVLIVVIGFFGLIAGSFVFVFGFIGAGLLAVAVLATLLPILMLYVAYEFSYARVRSGDLAGARGPTLLLGILGIFLGGLIVGILYLIAYVEIGKAENELRSMGVGPGGYANPSGNPYGTPYGYRPPAYGPGAVAYAPPVMAPPSMAATCPRCGRPATFIPQYGRSYCYACAQYL